jgi:rare lipoprotein A
MDKLTAAHRTLPFGTRVLVENQSNGKTVEVRVTDRGPFIDGRIIDLSRAAADHISMIGPGTAKVSVCVLGYGPAAGAAAYAVQVGVFSEKDRADALMADLATRFSPVAVVRRDGSPPTYRVLVGNKTTREEAEASVPSLKRWSDDAFVVRLDQ